MIFYIIEIFFYMTNKIICMMEYMFYMTIMIFYIVL
jgi:hypothetical protein